MLRHLFGALVAAAMLAALVYPQSARPSTIEVKEASLQLTEEGYAVSADFDIDLTTRIAEALHSGVSLYFLVEFELVRPRWYWFDEKTVASKFQYRLTYHALSRQYRLWTGTLHQPFSTLQEALRVLGRVRSWVVLGRDQIMPEQVYQAAVRMRLDSAQLPRPFQMTAIATREWTLESDWKRFPFSAQAANGRRSDERAPQ